MLKLWIGGVIGCLMFLGGCGKERKPPEPAPKVAQVSPAQMETIQWVSSYSEGLEMAKKSQKPMMLYFTGSDWCQWCGKLDSEILNTSAFASKVSDQFIFVRVDFPRTKPLPEEQAKANERLREQFQVRGFPTVVILNSKGELLGTVGYQPTSPELYADTLLTMAQSGGQFVTTMAQFEPGQLSIDQLRELYQQAEMLARRDEAMRILTAALEKAPQDPFFLAQRYRTLLEAGKYGTPEAQTARAQLLQSSPAQTQELAFFVAFLDFRALAANGAANPTPDKVVAPLEQFLQEHPASPTSTYAWRVEMILGEYLASRADSPGALAYLKKALLDAPDRVKPHIQKSIDLLEQKHQAASI